MKARNLIQVEDALSGEGTPDIEQSFSITVE